MVCAVGAELGLFLHGLLDQNRPVPSLFGAEFVRPKQAGVEFVWCRHSWCSGCRVCEVPSLQGAEVSGNPYLMAIHCCKSQGT